jgi:hypothetical protein
VNNKKTHYLKYLLLGVYIFIVLGSLAAEQDINQKYINYRVEKMLSILFDPFSNMEGFSRTDVNVYVENDIEYDTHIMKLIVKNNITDQISDYKGFPQIDFINAAKCKGAYLTALEDNGFYYVATMKKENITGNLPVGTLVYMKSDEERNVYASVSEKEESEWISIIVTMFMRYK